MDESLSAIWSVLIGDRIFAHICIKAHILVNTDGLLRGDFFFFNEEGRDKGNSSYPSVTK